MGIDCVLTHGGSLEVGGEEEGGEADEGPHAGGLLPVAPAVLGEDVDLGGLEAEAGVDPDHAAGPAGWEWGVGWDLGILEDPRFAFFTPFPSFLWKVGKNEGRLQAELGVTHLGWARPPSIPTASGDSPNINYRLNIIIIINY